MLKFTKYRREINNILTRYGGSNLRIFGSTARGETTESSDLDILIDLEENRSLLDLIAIKQDLEDLLGCKVDVLTEKGLSPYLRDSILEEAVAF